MIKVDDRLFTFDIKKICSFINDITGKEQKENEILDSYDFGDEGEKKLSAKTVRELTVPGNGQETITYDLIKIFIIQVVAFDAEGDIELDDLPFGTKLAFNTLITEGFLKEING